MIRDVAVKVPEPEDFLTEAIFPSNIVVPRCSGNDWCEVSGWEILNCVVSIYSQRFLLIQMFVK